MENFRFLRHSKILFHHAFIWFFFPIEDLRQAVEASSRNLTKEKIDRQLAGQSTSALFKNIKDNPGPDKRTVLLDIKMF